MKWLSDRDVLAVGILSEFDRCSFLSLLKEHREGPERGFEP